MIKIDKGFPLPLGGRNGYAKYPWRQMKIGDSFLVRNASTNKLNSAAWQAKKYTKFIFTVRTIGKDVRVWRTK